MKVIETRGASIANRQDQNGKKRINDILVYLETTISTLLNNVKNRNVTKTKLI